MTKHAELAVTPRDRYLEAAQKELIEFERREREFSRKERKERAAELSIPATGFTISWGQPGSRRPRWLDRTDPARG